ncbi:hypothetical protein [Streptomyces sp. GQFP]|uniref:hypothetical protein n=1 Tax=Streptomyces sp. GQFP TaxID=2907545 RepID=UPI001F299038|nr:hypothetical protein [Streptomyces sp. GQFP]UIX32262.1 hypothetical protein LUX31_20680 [Streptomyces sp. GQFP]
MNLRLSTVIRPSGVSVFHRLGPERSRWTWDHDGDEKLYGIAVRASMTASEISKHYGVHGSRLGRVPCSATPLHMAGRHPYFSWTLLQIFGVPDFDNRFEQARHTTS